MEAWEKAKASVAARGDQGPAKFTVGQRVWYRVPAWLGFGHWVIITGMQLHLDGRIQCAYVDEDTTGIGSAPEYCFEVTGE